MASRIDNITYVVMFQVKAGLSALERREVGCHRPKRLHFG
jgi:hypothetical protein